jgi:heme/copper-type cytochrome/quinol oxidase subunit 2
MNEKRIINLIIVLIMVTVLYIFVIAIRRRKNYEGDNGSMNRSIKLPTIFYIISMILFSILLIRELI